MKPLATNIRRPDDDPIFIGLRKFPADSCTGLLDVDERGRRTLKFAATGEAARQVAAEIAMRVADEPVRLVLGKSSPRWGLVESALAALALVSVIAANVPLLLILTM